MLATLSDAEGTRLNATIELEAGAIIVHSRGGAFGKPNLRNPDYRKAIRTVLDRLAVGDVTPSGIWLDSRGTQTWSETERLLVDAAEFDLPSDQLATLIGQRGAAKGRDDAAAGSGNSTKRVRIGVPGASIEMLQALLATHSRSRSPRLPAETLHLVEPVMIDEAIGRFLAGAEHNFHNSNQYDILLPSGERLPPKAIFGIALERVIGRPAIPADFSAGWGEPCFGVIQDAGYTIVEKGETIIAPSPDADDERTWAEGCFKRVQHLRRERAVGLARTKKRRFVEQHGHLFCERCGLVPSGSLGPFGDACIEVHHRTIAVAEMTGETRTRLADLQCLCANCHRIVHREQL